MEIIKDLPFPTISFIIGVIALVIAIARNVTIKEISIRMTLGQSIVLGLAGVVLIGIGVYGYFFSSSIPNASDASSQTPFAPPEASVPSYLEMNAKLHMGQELRSSNGRFGLSLYLDGNLVLYDYEMNAPIWASETAGGKADYLIMQEDGNLVLYAVNGDVLWASETASEQSGRLYRFQINDDGNMVIMRDGYPMWASNTNY